MTPAEVRAGRYRVVSTGLDSAVIVEIDGTFTELNQVLRIESPGSQMHVQNCAVMLAQVLNSSHDLSGLDNVLADD